MTLTFLEQIRILVKNFGWRDIVEIAIVGYAIYRVLLLLHRSRAVSILIGVVVLLMTYAAAAVLKLTMITYVLGLLYTYGAIALLIIFAPELRATLAHLGRSPMSRFFTRLGESEVAEQIGDAVERLSRSGVGAIIAVEREVPLDEYIHSGSEMQAKVSADLLATIFTPYSPLHDGAVIVRGDTIVGAGCILPLSQIALLDRSLGTRHRAALGLSEESDAFVIVVSEETSAISVALQGKLWRNLTAAQVRDMLAGTPPRQVLEPQSRMTARA
ncbi:MAG TPA: diadenylate cyclase CdaA [Gemmatimonadaceae bacterium]|nr:diadenylate cyclase CdaA [Gemmatimonadaceae bacterium]